MAGVDEDEDENWLYFCLIGSKGPVTTFESRIKIKRSVSIKPNSLPALLRLMTDQAHARNLAERLEIGGSVVPLSPKLSSHLIDRLASLQANHGPMRVVAESLSSPKYFDGISAMQDDAVRTALKAFGLSPDERAQSLELTRNQETALARIGIMEDSVVEHDARYVPGFDLVGSDLTGHAVFQRGNERLDVFTANNRPLEHAFGVDLIYLNASRQNIVMLQYKMLEPSEGEDETDWVYRPDAKLNAEIRRMRSFLTHHAPLTHEYRINPGVFYLKFVKRDGSIRNGSVITPIEHFEKLRTDPACQGPRGGIRITYNSLAGRYLRESPFLDLIRAGYIGAHAETTQQMRVLVNAVLRNDKAVVAAVQQRINAGNADDDEEN